MGTIEAMHGALLTALELLLCVDSLQTSDLSALFNRVWQEREHKDKVGSGKLSLRCEHLDGEQQRRSSSARLREASGGRMHARVPRSQHGILRIHVRMQAAPFVGGACRLCSPLSMLLRCYTRVEAKHSYHGS